MQILTPRVDFAAFLERVRVAPHRVLMLDYDGTLAPYHVDPELAVPYPDVAVALEDIVQAGGTRVVLVSGRPAEDLPRLLKLTQRPEIWGAHGWERLLPDGSLIVDQPDAGTRKSLSDALRITRQLLPAGARLEEKIASIAVHWRGLPALTAENLREQVRQAWEPLAREAAVEIMPFDCGLELRASGCNKQSAVKAILSETPEVSAVAYLGDDITDEDAFRAVKPRGLSVLVRAEFRETNADMWIRPPAELLSFMRHWNVRKR